MEAAEDVVVDNGTGEADIATVAAATVARHTPWAFHPHSQEAFPHQLQRQRDKRQRQQTSSSILTTGIVVTAAGSTYPYGTPQRRAIAKERVTKSASIAASFRRMLRRDIVPATKDTRRRSSP
jgi:hypothetical protein